MTNSPAAKTPPRKSVAEQPWAPSSAASSAEAKAQPSGPLPAVEKEIGAIGDYWRRAGLEADDFRDLVERDDGKARLKTITEAADPAAHARALREAIDEGIDRADAGN